MGNLPNGTWYCNDAARKLRKNPITFLLSGFLRYARSYFACPTQNPILPTRKSWNWEREAMASWDGEVHIRTKVRMISEKKPTHTYKGEDDQ